MASPRMERLKALLAEYGRVAIGVYLVLFVLVLAGFMIAIGLAGYAPEGAAGGAGLLGAAWLATKLTQPLRILATLALTPLISAGLARLKRRRAPEAEAEAEREPEAEAAPEAEPEADAEPAPPPDAKA